MTTPTTFDVTSHATADRRLAGWRENVGQPVAIDQPGAAAAGGRTLTVLSWNVWVGRGRLAELIRRIRNRAYAMTGAMAETPFVVLVQEAFRADASIPATSNGWAPREVAGRARAQEDIVELAHGLGLSLRYVPSMRNGADRSDRGNAILSSLPLGDTRAIELPFVFQRRVIATTTIDLAGHAIRLVSAHLDPRGPPDHRWLGAAGRAQQAAHLADAIDDDTVVLGADLNLARGRREGAWRQLAEADFAFGVPATLPTWRHTYHALPRLVLDYLLVRNRRRAITSATIQRLDEDPADRGATVFGSDHHPLLACIELA